jgi:hypothetical protein
MNEKVFCHDCKSYIGINGELGIEPSPEVENSNYYQTIIFEDNSGYVVCYECRNKNYDYNEMSRCHFKKSAIKSKKAFNPIKKWMKNLEPKKLTYDELETLKSIFETLHDEKIRLFGGQ